MSHREVIGKMCQQNCGRLIVKTDILLHTRDLIPELNLVLLIQEMHIAIIFTHCFIESQLSESLQDYNLSLIALSFKDKAQRFFDNGRRNRSFFDCSSTSYSKQGVLSEGFVIFAPINCNFMVTYFDACEFLKCCLKHL